MDKRNFYHKVWILVFPMALQNLINVGVSAADVVMLGRVGEKVLSGCSLGGQPFWILSLFLFGSTSGASVLVAQYWGKQDIPSIEKILGIVLRITACVALLFMALTLLFPEQIMSVYTKDPEVIAQGVRYMQIVAFTYPLSAITMTYLNLLKSMEKVVISTIVYASSLLLNIGLNAVLIYGLFGMPAMGIRGAAVATLCARMLELLLALAYGRFCYAQVRIRLNRIIHPDRMLQKDFLHYAMPVVCNEIIWGLGYSANAAVMGNLGSSAVAANSVSQIARQLSMVIGFGIAGATSIMIGKAIGEGKQRLAEQYASLLAKLALISGILGGLLIVLLRPLIISALGMSGEAAAYLGSFLLIMAYYVVIQAYNTTMVVGIFRAGGDTRFGMILDTVTMWGGSILFGALAAFVFHVPVVGVYAILMCDELLKLPLILRRYKQKKWLMDVTR